MIDKVLTRPLLTIATWIKRNPGASLIVFLLLWIAPPFLEALYLALRFVVNTVHKIFGGEVAKAVNDVLTKVYVWVSQTSGRCGWVALGVSIVSPLVGGALAVWCLLDSFKKPIQGVALPVTPAPQEFPEATQPSDTTGQAKDYYDQLFPTFGGYA